MHSLLRVHIAAAVLLLVHCSQAQTPQAASPTPETRPSGSVWVVKSATGGRLYLCGTIHLLREADYPLAPAYEAAYADAQKLIFELPPGSAHGSELNMRMQKLAALPAGTLLESVVGAELSAEVTKWAQAHHLSPATLGAYQPWYAALMIAAVEYGALGADPDKGVDNYFEARAEHDKKPGAGLETVEFQINLFSKLTAGQQQDLLKQTLAEIKTLPKEFTKLIKAWKEGDLDALHQMLYREAEQFPELMDLFLINRNQAWIDRLDAALKNGEHVMLLVGTGHFTGKQGLIELLKAKGYTVERYQSVP